MKRIIGLLNFCQKSIHMTLLCKVIVLLIIIFAYVGYAGAADITLRWDANTETDLAGYKLYYKTDTPGSPYYGTGADQGTSPVNIPLDTIGFNPAIPEYTLTGLDAEHVYFLVLTAYDDAGNESGYSNEVSTFYISFPQNNGFYINSDNYTAFRISGRGAAGYEVKIYSGSTLVGTTTTNTDGAWEAYCNFTGVAEGNVDISARTTVIDELTSNTITGTLDITAPSPPEPPSVPEGLRADTMSDSQINLEWEAVDGATGYTIYRDDVKLCDIDTNSYNDFDLAASTTYEYEVASFYDVDNPSERSELVSTTTSAAGTSTVTSSSSGSGGGCLIASTEKIENLLIKIGAAFVLLTFLAIAIVGLEYTILVVSKFSSDIKTIIITSSVIIIFVILSGGLVWYGMPIIGIIVALLFVAGICGTLVKLFSILTTKWRLIKC